MSFPKSSKINLIKSSNCAACLLPLSSEWLCNAEVKVRYKGTIVILEKFTYDHWLDTRSQASLKSFEKQLITQIECLGILGLENSSICLRSLEYLEIIKQKRKALVGHGIHTKRTVPNPDKSKRSELTNSVTCTIQHDPLTDNDLIFSDESTTNNRSACTSPGNVSDKDYHRRIRTVETKLLKSKNEVGYLTQPNSPSTESPVQSDLATKIALFESLSRNSNSPKGNTFQSMSTAIKKRVQGEIRNQENLGEIAMYVRKAGHKADGSFENEQTQDDTKPEKPQVAIQVQDKLSDEDKEPVAEYPPKDKHPKQMEDISKKMQILEKIDPVPTTLAEQELCLKRLVENTTFNSHADENEEGEPAGRILEQRTSNRINKNTQLKESLLNKIAKYREKAKQTELNEPACSGRTTFEKEKDELKDILHSKIKKRRSQRAHYPEQNWSKPIIQRVQSKPFTRIEDLEMRERVGLVLSKHRILFDTLRRE